MAQRFEKIVGQPAFPETQETCWWWDLERPLPADVTYIGRPFRAVQTPANRDANNYIRQEQLFLVFTDQAEYYAVCLNCKTKYGMLEWSGSTVANGWQKKSESYLVQHLTHKGWCEFCDPAFGNGGWID